MKEIERKEIERIKKELKKLKEELKGMWDVTYNIKVNKVKKQLVRGKEEWFYFIRNPKKNW